MEPQVQTGQPAVSIIVPVYHAEATLERCIKSVLSQEFKNYELLLVDDGSTDRSGEICDTFAMRDSRIRVIHKANSGVSDSRNQAIQQARGVYLQFMDSDDWLSPDATKRLVFAAEQTQCDLVISDFYRVVDERFHCKGSIPNEGLLSREEFALYMLEKPADYYFGVLWNKLYQHKLIAAHQLKMDKEIDWCEDFMFNLEYIRYTKTIFVLRTPIYYYVKTRNSLSTQVFSLAKILKIKATVFESYKRFYQDVFGIADYEKCKYQVYRFFLASAGDGSVPPIIFPGTFQVGEDNAYINQSAIAGDNILIDIYRKRKFLEQYMKQTAVRARISWEEVLVLYCLRNGPLISTAKEISDLTGLTARKTGIVLKKLKQHTLLDWTEQPPANRRKSEKKAAQCFFQMTANAQPVLADLEELQCDYETVLLEGFSVEEIAAYRSCEHRAKDNLNQRLTNDQAGSISESP